MNFATGTQQVRQRQSESTGTRTKVRPNEPGSINTLTQQTHVVRVVHARSVVAALRGRWARERRCCAGEQDEFRQPIVSRTVCPFPCGRPSAYIGG